MENIAWHFTGDTLRDGSPIPSIGQKLVFPGKIKICRAGYHWSEKPHQALRYAPGAMLHKVQYGGEVQREDDKGVSSERTILATIDATNLLRRFAADKALSVAHMWDMPDVVREYLMTLDENIRSAAFSAAWSAALSAEGSAAWSASWIAAHTAQNVARDAALSTEWKAARLAVLSDARNTARDEFDGRVYEAFSEITQ